MAGRSRSAVTLNAPMKTPIIASEDPALSRRKSGNIGSCIERLQKNASVAAAVSTKVRVNRGGRARMGQTVSSRPMRAARLSIALFTAAALALGACGGDEPPVDIGSEITFEVPAARGQPQ